MVSKMYTEEVFSFLSCWVLYSHNYNIRNCHAIYCYQAVLQELWRYIVRRCSSARYFNQCIAVIIDFCFLEVREKLRLLYSVLKHHRSCTARFYSWILWPHRQQLCLTTRTRKGAGSARFWSRCETQNVSWSCFSLSSTVLYPCSLSALISPGVVSFGCIPIAFKSSHGLKAGDQHFWLSWEKLYS